MAIDRQNVAACPSCGADNIEGTDTCENCQADLSAIDVPDSAQVASENDLTRPISSMRLAGAQTVSVTATARDAIAVLREGVAGAVVVVSGTAIVGIFTERDVLKKVAGKADAQAAPVAAYMTPDPVVLRDDDRMAVALNKMGDGGFRHIPVTRDGRLVGMVTAGDVMSWVLGRYFD